MRRSVLPGCLAATVSLGLAPAATVRAAEPGRSAEILLEVRACPEPFEVSLRRILAIELGGLLDEGKGPPSPSADSMLVACESETARIAARSARGEVVHNDVRFDAFPGDAAPRAVALAALEALRAVDPSLAERIVAERAKSSAPEPEAKPATRPRATPSSTRDGARVRAAARSVTPRAFTRVVVGGMARWFLGEPSTLAAGGRLELSRRFASPWDAGVDVDGALARRRVALGSVEGRLLSTAAWFGARAGGVAWSVTGGLGGRLGLVLLNGVPGRSLARGSRSTRAWGGPALSLRTDGSLGSVALSALVEGGLAAAGAEGLAGGVPVIGFTGGWVSASANVGLRF